MLATSVAADPASMTTIGVVGGGQLAWMLAAAADDLGLELRVQTPSSNDPATRLAKVVEQAPLDDVEATRKLALGCTAITFENEWVNLEGLAALASEGVTFLPSLHALEPLVCKRRQRELLQQLRLPAPAWLPLGELLVSLTPPADSNNLQPKSPLPVVAPLQMRPGWQFPLMAKAITGGYDGKGTEVLHNRSDLDRLLQRVESDHWIVEALVAFDLELSQLVARDCQGNVVCYPLVQTQQHSQVCDWVLAPADVPHAVQAYARNVAASLLTALDYVGVLCIEFFYGPQGLQVNEVAPRTHNSGHLTIEAAQTSQFAQQARIVAGLPMGSVELKVPGALMVNLLGFECSQHDYGEQRRALASLPGATVHWYGKQGSTPGRKLGHVTLVLDGGTAALRERQAQQCLAAVRAIWPLPAT